MLGDTRRFRLFVSSTFRDFGVEREALRREVYPCLRRLCEAHGATFEAVDLRWGVSREAAEHQRTMAICLQEVDRCAHATARPNFLLLMGDRLGWRPLPAEIQAALFADLVKLLGSDPAHAQAAELLHEWYGNTRDDNAVPAVHRLGPAERTAGDEVTLRQSIETVLGDVAPEMHAVLVGGATEQEVRRRLALGPIDGGRAVIAARDIKNVPNGPEAAAFADLDASGRPDRSARARQLKLRAELESLPGVDWLAYDAPWTSGGMGPGELVDDLDRILEPSRRPDVEAQLGGVEHLRALRNAASASSPVVAADPSQLPSQLCGRIAAEHESLRCRLRGWRGEAWLEPLRPTLQAGPLRFTLSGHRGTVRSVAVSNDGRWCATAGNSAPDRTIRVWSVTRGEQLRVFEDLAEAGRETPLAFDSTGTLLVGCNREGVAVDVLSGRTRRLLDTGGDRITCLAAAANAPVAVAGADRFLYVCRQGTGEEPKLIDVGSAVVKVAATPDGRHAAALTADGVSLLDLEHLSQLAGCEREIDVGTGYWDRPPLAVAPTGDTVFFGRDLIRWYPASGEVEEVVAGIRAASMDAPRAVLALTPDGKRALVSPSVDDMRHMALSSDRSRSVALWSPGRGPEGPAILGPGRLVSAAALTGDGEVAVVAYDDHSVRVWGLEVATGRQLYAHDNPVHSIIVEGEHALTIDQGNIVQFWSLSSGQPVEQSETRKVGR